MKLLNVFLIFTVSTLSSFALAQNYLQNISPEVCPGLYFSSNKSTIYCQAFNTKQVQNARVGSELTKEELRRLKISRYSAIEAGLVSDNGSDSVYFFTRWLLNAQSQKVGVVTYEGWVNKEMGKSARFDFRYNLKGQIVSVSQKTLR